MKVTAQEIIQDLRRLHQALGRVPTRMDYERGGAYPGSAVTAVFGSYHLMIKMSGLEYQKGKRDKEALRAEAFLHNQKLIETLRPMPAPPKLSARHLFISDLHEPYAHPDRREFLEALDDTHKFDRTTIGGDEIDGHAWSFHEHDPDNLSPGHELDAAIRRLEWMYKRWPEADVLESNHGSLIHRKAKHHGLPRHVIKPYGEVLGAPKGWKWHEELVVQFTNGKTSLVHHGLSPNILLASQKRSMSLIQFHFHSKFSINYWKNQDGLYFTMQCACLIDDLARAFSYNKLTIERPIIGVGAVFDGQPRLFPMLLNSKGRWTGKL